jgi:hypothetical protein
MARYAGGGKNTVESCRSIDVLEWHRRGYLRSPRGFSWTWTSDGERVASINVETQRHYVLLKYRSCSYARIGVMSSNGSPSPGRYVGSVENDPGLCVRVAANGVYCGRRATKLYGAGRLFACRHCYQLAYASQQESAHQRELGKSQKIRMQLGGSSHGGEGRMICLTTVGTRCGDIVGSVVCSSPAKDFGPPRCLRGYRRKRHPNRTTGASRVA